MDEQALIDSARKGDARAFNRLVLLYQSMAYSVAYRILNDQDAAADATQDAFLKAFKAMRRFRGGSFKAWLLRIVTNACYDELRRRKRRPTTPLEPMDAEDEEIESPHWLADPSESPEDRTERLELDQAIQNCLEDLPPDFRSVVVLVDIQGFDYIEAAEVIKKPVGTVKSRLSRARLRLRDCLQGWWELIPAQFRLVNEGKP